MDNDEFRMSVRRISQDHSRFKQIVRGQIKQDLRKYITQGELVGRVGKDMVSIPLPQIELPRFKYGDKQVGGVGQGEGEPGTPVGGDEAQGSGPGEAGEAPGQHAMEVEVSLEELAKIMGEELALPDILPKGRKHIISEKINYNDIRRVGPESLRHFKRTFREALKRQIASGEYDMQNPRVIPQSSDKRYRSWKDNPQPESNAVIVYMMDVSGSMGNEQKEIVRIEAFWIDTWLKHQYKNIESRYIVHDAAAKEVDEHTFYHLKESGGTKISSAYKLCMKIIEEEYNPDDWNIYPFHFSDGDNWGGDDTRICIDMLKKEILPAVNMFCYGQVKSAYGSGQFKKDLDGTLSEEPRVITSEIRDRDGIYDSIKEFLGKGN